MDSRKRFIDYFNDGESYLKDKWYNSAIEAFTNAIKLNPKRITPYFSRALAYYEIGDFANTISDCSHALVVAEYLMTEMSYEKENYISRWDIEKEKEVCRKINRVGMNRATLYKLRAMAYHAIGEMQQALIDYTKAVVSGESFFSNVMATDDDSDIRNVIDVLSTIRCNRGKLYFELGEIDKSIADYKRADEINPTAETSYSLANSYFTNGDKFLAAAYYQKTIMLNPNFPAPYNNLGTLYFKMDFVSSGLCYKTALSLAPKKFMPAYIEFAKKLELSQQSLHAGFMYDIIANQYLQENNFHNARVYYDKALELNPMLLGYISRGVCYQKMGVREKAIADYQWATQLIVTNSGPIDYETLKNIQLLIHDLSYETKELDLLDEKTTATIMEESEKQYKHLPDFVSETAFVWRATKKGYGAIYLFFTMHEMAGVDIKDIFKELIKKMVSEVIDVYNEVQSSTHPTYVDCTVVHKLDLIIASEAVKQNKKLKPLENSMIRNIANPGSNSNLSFNINGTIQSDTKNYLTHCAESIQSSVVRRRDCFWTSYSILPGSAAGRDSLIVLGSGHHELVEMLRAKGYKVKRKVTHAPVGEMEMGRLLYYGNSPLTFFKSDHSKEKHKTQQNRSCSNSLSSHKPALY